jgi:hypothetical protein
MTAVAAYPLKRLTESADANRNRAQPLKSLGAEKIALAQQQADPDQARQRVQGAVHVRQQRHVSGGVQAGEWVPGRAAVLFTNGLTAVPAQD